MPLTSSPDFIGTINVPEIVPSETFPLAPPDYPHGQRIARRIVTHPFISANGKIEQRFLVGPPVRRWKWQWTDLSIEDMHAIQDFYAARLGPYDAFFLDVPTDDGSDVEQVVARFEDAPLTWDAFEAVARIGIVFVEIPQGAPPS